MKTYKNYSIAVIDDYTLYYLGMKTLITKEFGENVQMSRYYTKDVDDLSTSSFNSADLVLLHIPLSLQNYQIGEIIRKIKTGLHHPSLIIYTTEPREELQHMEATGVKGVFHLGDKSKAVSLLISNVLKTSNNSLPEYSKYNT